MAVPGLVSPSFPRYSHDLLSFGKCGEWIGAFYLNQFSTCYLGCEIPTWGPDHCRLSEFTLPHIPPKPVASNLTGHLMDADSPQSCPPPSF